MQHTTVARHTVRLILTTLTLALLAIQLLPTPAAPVAQAQGEQRKTYLSLVGANMGSTGTQPTPVPTQPTSPVRSEGQQLDIAAEVLRLVNVERAKVNCPALIPQDQLTAAAEGHSQHQALNDYYSHIAPKPNRTSPGMRISATGYEGLDVNENLAAGSGDAAILVNAWMSSMGHRSTMLSCDFHYAGVAVYYQPSDEGNVQAVDFFTGERIPFGPDGYSTDPMAGVPVKGPYYYYTTLNVGAEPTLAQVSEAPTSTVPTR
jgi:uncharacterized protein YkwD